MKKGSLLYYPAKIEVHDWIEHILYPTEFDLFTASDLASVAGEFQAIVSRAGTLPVTESLLISRLMRLCMPGLGDAQYARCDAEIERHLNVPEADLSNPGL